MVTFSIYQNELFGINPESKEDWHDMFKKKSCFIRKFYKSYLKFHKAIGIAPNKYSHTKPKEQFLNDLRQVLYHARLSIGSRNDRNDISNVYGALCATRYCNSSCSDIIYVNITIPQYRTIPIFS